MDRRIAVWFAIAGLTAMRGLSALVAGEGGVLPGLLSAVALGCAVDARIRDRVMGKAMWAFSGSGVRAAMILIGAMMLWQLVGVELALLMAGDVLVYVEALAAVSLIAANTRLRPLAATATNRLASAMAALTVRRRAVVRAIRSARPVRRKPGRADDADGAAAWAFA